ncbi:hypothetical protein Q31b_58170 [Novipirellula aureliae]|uniref:Uncharacterized protein n=1 Tax=Novipirellula aureliae TaxID=2527966 RepID=A0A5C6DAC2_9BACT|nr:hypothetical protein [Novipirellula aureliae]TWU32774.1 hypothetical protein Q31b_58170 [Novipirellula aureliae]
MIDSKHITTDTTVYVIGSVLLVVFIGAVSGFLGTTTQSIALYVTLFLVPVCVTLFIRLSVWLLNRTCRYCREALAMELENGEASDINPITERLKSTVDSKRLEEESYVARYARRRCSSDDVLRAQSLRVQAEIELLRHEKMPRSWSDICGEGYGRR